MNYEEIGQRIRYTRKMKQFSQEQLSEMIGISPTHMSHIETGATKLSLPVLADIAKSLEISTDWLLYGTYNSTLKELTSIISNCSPAQLKAIITIANATKTALDEYGIQEQQN